MNQSSTPFHFWRTLLSSGVLLVLILAALAAPAEGRPPRTAASQDVAARPPIALVHNGLGEALPGSFGQQVRICDTPSQFERRQTRFAHDPAYVGSLLIQAEPATNTAWIAPPGGQVHVRTVVHDLAAMEDWVEQGIVPGFLLGEEVPTIEPGETACEIEVVQRLPQVEIYVRFAVRASDGKCALREVRYDGVAISIGSGPWWPVCCGSQWLLCELARVVSPSACAGCYEQCFLRCLSATSNPCHSCGDCGLSSFLCRFVPGGRC